MTHERGSPRIDTDGALIAYDAIGSGRRLLLLHAGIADRRMWDDQVDAFSDHYLVIRCDLPGFGQSCLPVGGPFAMRTAVATFLEQIDAVPAIVVGCSFGARVAIELAVDRPELVEALVLVCPGVADHEWSDAVTLAEREIERALEAGDLDAAAEVDVRVWVDGPHRSPDQVDPYVRASSAAMARGVYEVMTSAPEPDLTPIPLDPPAIERLETISVPTLVVTGELDQPDIQVIADVLTARIPGAREVTMSGVAHLPNMERPDLFNEIVLGFLKEISRDDLCAAS